MNWSRWSLKRRFFLLVFSLVLTTALSFALLVRLVVISPLVSSYLERGQDLGRAIGTVIGEHISAGDKEALKELLVAELEIFQRHLAALALLDEMGEVTIFVSQRADLKQTYQVEVPLTKDGHRLGTLKLFLKKGHIDATIWRLGLIFIAVVSLVLLILVGAVHVFVRSISRPITYLMSLAEEVARENLNVFSDLGERVRCWEMVSCPKRDCPAYGQEDVPCWLIDKTGCFQCPEGSFPQKIEYCRRCPVYRAHAGHNELVQLGDVFNFMILQLREGREALERARALRESLIENSLEAIVAADARGNIIIFNEAASSLFGYRPDQVIGELCVWDLFPEGMWEGISNRLKTGQTRLKNLETLVVTREGEEVPVWLNAAILTDERGEMGVVCFIKDWREIRYMEERLLETERLANIGRGVAHVVHEIKNPLVAIGGLARRVLKSIPSDNPNALKLRIILQEIERLLAMLEDIRDFTKATKLHKRQEDINMVVEESILLMQSELTSSKIELVLDLDSNLPCIPYDFDRIKQVLINLIENAIEAMPEGGKLTIRTYRDSPWVVIVIEDTGKGIPSEELDKVFDPFFTTKARGTGLGLPISKRIVEDHGGILEIRSRLGQGTRCLIKLPIPIEEHKEASVEVAGRV
ncbi:two-component system sensor histidine kinase NtrB [Thermosulfuriphilus sp.]